MSSGYPSPKAPRDHLPLVFGRRGLLHKNAGTQAPEEGSPTNVRCKAPHLIKIILAYSPKKKEQTPLKTRVRYNKAISVRRPSHGAIPKIPRWIRMSMSWIHSHPGASALLRGGVFIDREVSRG
ncbi:unnamed protein product [Sphenostylis stenocarpa]|uniref:Uncharacterized protein n=2 Tax=Mesangiospermae TaxID=1437183 RepID=A0AA86SG44_9FABA|nr:unnamed protein product [Sphenostylis stenocarpa]